MITVKEDTTLVGISELRDKAKVEDILKTAKKRRVVIEKRHKPVAVLLSMEIYEQLEQLIDLIEDQTLGKEAKARLKQKKKPLSIEAFEKRIGLV